MHLGTDSLTLTLGELADPLPIPVLGGRGRGVFMARVRPPGSKSLTNRGLLLAALASGRSVLRRPLLGADDAEQMVGALRVLGATVNRTESGDLEVVGTGGRWKSAGPVTLNLNNAGTATRFLAASAVLSPAPLVVDGNERMRQRPIGELVDALGKLGVEAEYLGMKGCPPVRLTPPAQGPSAASLTLPTTLSSQFISALLLVAPFLPGGLTLRLDGKITSRSYIAMTLGLLDQLGVTVKSSDNFRIHRVSTYTAMLPGFEYNVEPDASSATYFWAAAALFAGATCRVEGLDARSLQADVQFPETLSRMGATVLRDEASADGPAAIGVRGPASLAPVMADMSLMPDAAMTLAVVACFASGRSVLRGLRTLRVKESDRIAGLQAELAKIGVRVETNVLGDPDAITITPPEKGVDCSTGATPVTFATYDDHRMAMALALVGLKRPGVTVANPGCVGKTYPGFWKDLAILV